MNLDGENLKYQQQLTWRLWGEEKTKDAIYTVYLKKMRYYRSLQNLTSDSDDEISHLEWETVRVKFIKAGTLEKLVECLTSDDGELESTYINIFFSTYRTFASPTQVLTLMLDKYEQLINNELDLSETVTEQFKKSIVVAIKVWLDSYPDDFRDPPLHTVLQQLIYFAQQYLSDSELLLKATHRIHRLTNESSLDSYLPFSNEQGICLNTNGYNGVSYNFPEIPNKHFAEQLTRIDMELFKRVVPHQCLGAIWSRKDKSRTTDAATVLATVNQFNAVSFRVISTILMDLDVKVNERAKIITTWIDIAQELRVLKNFSSLKAIISGLQSNSVYRLQKTWQMVAKEKVELFTELARIFSEDNNQWAQRELLMKEGTAKFADTVNENDRHLQKVIQRQLNNCVNISHGTIPYLGTFLTDLTMIDTAIPDFLSDGLINFDKRRKEFEVLAQIKLLQGAANAYHIQEDVAFDRWFDSILVLDDREAYSLSCQIESPISNIIQNNVNAVSQITTNINNNNNANNNTATKSRKPGMGHHKNDSIASTSSNSSSQFYFNLLGTDSVQSSPPNSLDRKISQTMPAQMSSSSSNSSMLSIDTLFSSNNNNDNTTEENVVTTNSVATTMITCNPLNSYSSLSSDFYIIRVTVDTDLVETDGIVLYKSIMLSNSEKTQQVIRNAMLKLGIEGNPEHYTLSQILPDKEMLLPANANVYYAVNTAHNLNFILRSKCAATTDKQRQQLQYQHATSVSGTLLNKRKQKKT